MSSSLAINDSGYEILTPNGWEDFAGVICDYGSRSGVKIQLRSGHTVTCTEDHLFYDTYDNTVKASQLSVGQTIRTAYGEDHIADTQSVIIEDAVYDIFNSDSNTILVNSIKSHQCDEIGFVKPHVAKKFWDSILPTISTGGGVILSSTPNGDIGLFAETWRQAQAGLNEFKDGVTYVPWYAPPGRDEAFKKKFIGLLGERKWKQEFECVTGDTGIIALDAQTGVELRCTIEQLYAISNAAQPDSNSSQTRYKILTSNGFRDFFAVTRKYVNSTLRLIFDNATTLGCTDNHMVQTSSGFVEAQNLMEGDVILPYNRKVVDILQRLGHDVVYDVVNVDGGNHYLTNGVTSHNCLFLTEDLTLVDSTQITEQELAIQNRPDYIKAQEFDIHEFKFFVKPTKGTIYMVGLDPSTGSGSDFTVIQVFEFPTLVQVAELRSNILSQKIVYSKLKSLLKYLCQFSEEVYFTVERNGVGAGVLALYENDENEVYGNLVSEDGKDKLGFYTTDKSKNKACLMIKDLFERKKVVMHSIPTLTEFKSFVRIGPSYKATIGATDDSIMAMVQIMYIIDQFANYNDDAFAMTMKVAPDIDEANSWELPVDEEEPLDYSTDMIYVG